MHSAVAVNASAFPVNVLRERQTAPLTAQFDLRIATSANAR